LRIAVLGAGAMGSLFGGYLSRENEVHLIDVNSALVAAINQNGLKIREKDGSEGLYRLEATADSSSIGTVDLIIVFVKSMYTISALESNKRLIGPDTYVMTLQNGSGHEAKLLKYVARDHVVIGSTQHNSSIIDLGFVNHGGGGKTSIGLLDGGSQCLAGIAENFTKCGFDCNISDNVRKQIWNKLFLNTSASSLTAVFQQPLGFIIDNQYACSLMEKLALEAVQVANAQGLDFNYEEVLSGIKAVLTNAKGGYTSIYADLRDGRRTEVDTISGSVVEAAKEFGISVPYHETVIAIIHAMEAINNKKQ
jgi:2-dehydropantoate 2-reductase